MYSQRQPTNEIQLQEGCFAGLRKALHEDPLENYLDEDNTIEDDWLAWRSALFSKINHYIPKLKPREFVTPPWMDGEVRHAIKKKNSLLKKATQKDNNDIWEKFREKRKEVKYLIRSKRTTFLQKDPKRFGGYFNRLTKRSTFPEAVELTGSSYTNSKDKATAFNTYFSSVFNTDTSIPDNLPTSPCTDNIVSTLEFSYEEVASALQRLNVS